MDIQKEKDALEAHQFENIYHEDDVPFQNASDSAIKRLIYYGIGLFVILIIASFLIKVPREIQIPFELKGGILEFIVQYPEKVYVKEIQVRTGDTIIRGQPLIKITSPEISSQINEIEALMTELSFFRHEKQDLYKSDLAYFEARKKGLDKDISKLSAEIEISRTDMVHELANLKEQLDIQSENLKRNQKLYADGFLSALELEKVQIEYNNVKQMFESKNSEYKSGIADLESRKQMKINEKNELVEQKVKTILLNKTDSIDLKNRLIQAEHKLQLTYGISKINGDGLNILSPYDGRISLITASESELLPGQIIVRMQTSEKAYYAYAKATPAEIGKLQEGNKAVLKYNSFPYYYYGTMKSVIESTSQSPDETGDYPIRMNITDMGNLKNKVRKGMTGNASIVVEEKSVADYLFRVFLKSVAIE